MSTSTQPLSSSVPFDFFSPGLLSHFEGFLGHARGPSSLYDLERLAQGLFLALGSRLLEMLAEALQAREATLPRPSCPDCGRAMVKNRRERRFLHLHPGILELWRWYFECRPCRRYLHPFDADLDLPRDGEMGFGFGHALSLLAAEVPFRTASRLLEILTGRKLSEGTIHEHLNREGRALLELEKLEARIANEVPEPGERVRLRTELPVLRSVPVPGQVLFVEIDGTMNNLGATPEIRAEVQAYKQLRKEARDQGVPLTEDSDRRPSPYRETLNARYYRIEDRVRKQTASGDVRTTIHQSEVVSVVNDPELFRARLFAVAQAWKTSKYPMLVVIGDGAVHDRGLADCLRAHPNVLEILDFFHAADHIYKCGKALFGDESSEAKGWSSRIKETLREEGPRPILRELRELATRTWPGSAATQLANLIAYVDTHQNRMRYPLFRDLGLSIGSGAIESTNRQVDGDRCKRSSMMWDRSRLQAMLSLRAAWISGNWDQACAAIRTTRSARPNSLPEITDIAPHLANQQTPDCPLEPDREELPFLDRPEPVQNRRRTLLPARVLDRKHAARLLDQTHGQTRLGPAFAEASP